MGVAVHLDGAEEMWGCNATYRACEAPSARLVYPNTAVYFSGLEGGKGVPLAQRDVQRRPHRAASGKATVGGR